MPLEIYTMIDSRIIRCIGSSMAADTNITGSSIRNTFGRRGALFRQE
ncbi:MAG: hypothetical protein LBE48_02445 [Methanomassiliicoccaceae archaeon]|nr:hypothetical protein [Methanomassiliicoccaceae archaeon]